MQREIQSVEVSYFVHATEEEARVRDAVAGYLQISQGPSREELEGHFGNRIVHFRYHLTEEDAWNAFGRLVKALGRGGVTNLLSNLDSLMDEHRALYLRLSKQEILRGRSEFAERDPVRIKVKVRSYMVKGDPRKFYRQLIERLLVD